MGNLDDDGASFEQSYAKSNGSAKLAEAEAATPISNGHIPHARVKESVVNGQERKKGEQDSEEQLLLKRLKFSAPAYTEIRTPSGGLNLKVSITTTKQVVWGGK